MRRRSEHEYTIGAPAGGEEVVEAVSSTASVHIQHRAPTLKACQGMESSSRTPRLAARHARIYGTVSMIAPPGIPRRPVAAQFDAEVDAEVPQLARSSLLLMHWSSLADTL